MGLPRAIHEHAAKNLYEAEKQYQRAYDRGDRSAVLFQNYGALLRNIDKIDAAEKLFDEGLKLHPNEPLFTRTMRTCSKINALLHLFYIIYTL